MIQERFTILNALWLMAEAFGSLKALLKSMYILYSMHSNVFQHNSHDFTC